MSILLIGYRGSGKSTIGLKLADRLWQSFVDTDQLVVRKAGKTIKEIFESEGEDRFRDIESDVIREVCHLEDHVIALGGGAVLREENRQALSASGHKVIYLKCEPDVLLQRIAGDTSTQQNRPHLTGLGGGIEEVREVLLRREPIYRQAMTSELDVTHLTPDEAVVYIVRML